MGINPRCVGILACPEIMPDSLRAPWFVFPSETRPWKSTSGHRVRHPRLPPRHLCMRSTQQNRLAWASRVSARSAWPIRSGSKPPSPSGAPELRKATVLSPCPADCSRGWPFRGRRSTSGVVMDLYLDL